MTIQASPSTLKPAAIRSSGSSCFGRGLDLHANPSQAPSYSQRWGQEVKGKT